MFVRWKMRRRRGRITYAAQLVRSYRLDGRPKQQVLCHLGSIRKGGEHFHWIIVKVCSYSYHKLASLGLDPATRSRAEASLIAVVPRPNAESLRSLRARLGVLNRRFRKAR